MLDRVTPRHRSHRSHRSHRRQRWHSAAATALSGTALALSCVAPAAAWSTPEPGAGPADISSTGRDGSPVDEQDPREHDPRTGDEPHGRPSPGAGISVEAGTTRVEIAAHLGKCHGAELVAVVGGLRVILDAHHRPCVPAPPPQKPPQPAPQTPPPASTPPPPPSPDKPSPQPAPEAPRTSPPPVPAPVVHQPPAAEVPKQGGSTPPKSARTSKAAPAPSPSRSRLTSPARLTPIQRHDDGRLPLVARTLLLVVPAVLAAAALRARRGRSGSSGRHSSGSGTSPFSR